MSKKIRLFLLFVLLLLLPVASVSAQDVPDDPPPISTPGDDLAGDVDTALGRFVNAAYYLAGASAIVVMIVGILKQVVPVDPRMLAGGTVFVLYAAHFISQLAGAHESFELLIEGLPGILPPLLELLGYGAVTLAGSSGVYQVSKRLHVPIMGETQSAYTKGAQSTSFR